MDVNLAKNRGAILSHGGAVVQLEKALPVGIVLKNADNTNCSVLH